jgi:hypothetical protein
VSDLDDEIRRHLEAAATAPPPPPAEAVADLLRSVWRDPGGGEAVDGELDRLAATDRGRRYLAEGAAALDAVVADPPASPTLLELVAWQANVALDDASDAGAADWLAALAGRIRARLA